MNHYIHITKQRKKTPIFYEIALSHKFARLVNLSLCSVLFHIDTKLTHSHSPNTKRLIDASRTRVADPFPKPQSFSTCLLRYQPPHETASTSRHRVSPGVQAGYRLSLAHTLLASAHRAWSVSVFTIHYISRREATTTTLSLKLRSIWKKTLSCSVGQNIGTGTVTAWDWLGETV